MSHTSIWLSLLLIALFTAAPAIGSKKKATKAKATGGYYYLSLVFSPTKAGNTGLYKKVEGILKRRLKHLDASKAILIPRDKNRFSLCLHTKYVIQKAAKPKAGLIGALNKLTSQAKVDWKNLKATLANQGFQGFHVVEDDAPVVQKIYNAMKQTMPPGVHSKITSYARPLGVKKPAPKRIQRKSSSRSKRAGVNQGLDRYFQSPDNPSLSGWIALWNTKIQKKYKGKYKWMIQKQQSSLNKPPTWRSILVHSQAFMGPEHIQHVKISSSSYYTNLHIRFTTSGAKQFATYTGRHVGHRFAIVVNGFVDSAPVIQTKITGGQAYITSGGLLSKQKQLAWAKSIIAILLSGKIPGDLDYLNEQILTKPKKIQKLCFASKNPISKPTSKPASKPTSKSKK